ncbi:MAG: hypothetical protein Q7S86_04180 [bacterium]|nr:hypothetical protein [bacterium]
MKRTKFLTFVLAFLAVNVTQAQTNTPKTFVTNTIVGKKFVWERVTEVGTTNVIVRVIDEVAPATVTANLPPAANTKAEKNAVPLLIARPDTNASRQVFEYKQYSTNRYGDGPGEVQRQVPGSTQWTGSAQPVGGTQNYAVDQRPLDPAPVAHYPTHQGIYPTAPATYPTHVTTYPVYAEQQWGYFPVAHYPTHGQYPTYGYGVGQGAYYGYSYMDRRNLFGIQFDAIVSPSYSYTPGWSARGHSHHENYPTHGDHRGRRR